MSLYMVGRVGGLEEARLGKFTSFHTQIHPIYSQPALLLYCPLSEKDSTELTGFQCKIGAKGLCGCVNGQHRGVLRFANFVIYR